MTALSTNVNGANREHFCRYRVAPCADKKVFFVPAEMDPSAASETILKRGFLGQAFKGAVDKIPKHAAAVLFESTLDESTNPCIRPTKPKLVLMGCLKMEPGKFYKLD